MIKSNPTVNLKIFPPIKSAMSKRFFCGKFLESVQKRRTIKIAKILTSDAVIKLDE